MTTCYLYNKVAFEKGRLSAALSKTFKVLDNEIYFSEDGKAPKKTSSIMIRQWKRREIPEDLRVEIILDISDKIFKRDRMAIDGKFCHTVDLEAARMITPHLGLPIVGSYEDVRRDELHFIKCYPDGSEERVEWPDSEA